MTPSGGHNLNYLPLGFFGVYLFVGALVFQRWTRRYRRQRLPPIHADPAAWLPSLLPQLIAGELYALLGAIGLTSWMLFTLGAANSAVTPYAWLGFGIALTFFVLLFAGIDVGIVVGWRAASRRTRHIAEADEPLEHQ